MRLRERLQGNQIQEIGRSYNRRYDAGPNAPWQLDAVYTTTAYIAGLPNLSVERTYDEIHKKRGSQYLEGGPFNKWAFTTDALSQPKYANTFLSGSGAYQRKYVGGFVKLWKPTGSQLGINYTLAFNPGKGVSFPNGENAWGDVSSYGATAWKKYRPGKPVADLAVFVGEISDVPRMLRSTAEFFYSGWFKRFGRNPKGSTRKAANYWLETQFGWLPFIGDLRRFYKTWKHADEIIAQLRRDNGNWVRRHGTVSKSETEDVLGQGFNLFPLPSSQFSTSWQNGKGVISLVKTQKVWFEALFRYWIPNIGSVAWEKKALAKLYGPDLTPAVVWELVPWSWLVDWFSNVGDVITNADTGLAQNLAAKFAYIMGTTTSSINVEDVVVFAGGRAQVMNWNFELQRKVRSQANPFGFGLTWDSLSLRQWSILSALGITRLH